MSIDFLAAAFDFLLCLTFSPNAVTIEADTEKIPVKTGERYV